MCEIFRNARQNILNKFIENPLAPASSIAKTLKLKVRTCQNVIKRYKETLSIGEKPRSGRKKGFVDKKLAAKVIRSFKTNPGLSLRDRAIRYGTSKSTIFRLRKHSGLKCYKAIKMPHRMEKQELTAKKRSRKLYDEVLTKNRHCIIMDDETYVKLDFKQLPGQRFYLSTFRGNVPARYKYVCVEKFAKKVMIWQGICSCGLRSSAFVTRRTMTADLYIDECLQKRLKAFIALHIGPVIFWPDLASAHYAKKTLGWFEANQVDIVTKEQNPPNCPKFCPIEVY
jgi:hypothetical protein